MTSKNIRIFKAKPFQDQLTSDEQDALIKDFKAYKSGLWVPSAFGRDARYDHINTNATLKQEEVSHLHLLDVAIRWPAHYTQYDKTSDDHLVYCPAALTPDCYLLIAVLTPDAHDQAKRFEVMSRIADIAERFREKY